MGGGGKVVVGGGFLGKNVVVGSQIDDVCGCESTKLKPRCLGI